MDALVEAGWKAALVLLAGGAAAICARRASAATRHLIWTAALAGALALPVLSAVLPRLEVALPVSAVRLADVPVGGIGPTGAPAGGIPSAGAPGNAIVSTAAPVGRPRFSLQPAEPSTLAALRGAARDWPRAVQLLWATVAMALFLRIAAGDVQLRAIARRASRAVDEEWLALLRDVSSRLGVRRDVQLLESPETDVPVTWGTLHPRIVLPEGASRWPAEQKRAVLVHELAHARRHDALTQLVARLACALHWPNPLAWAAARAMRTEREHACDDLVLQHGTRPTEYAASLLEVARRALSGAGPTAALAMARRSQLEGRLVAVLDPALDRRPLSLGRAVAGACAAGCLVLPLAAISAERGRRAEAAPESTPVVTSGRSASAPESRAAMAVRAAARPALAFEAPPTPPTPPAPPIPPTPPAAPAPPAPPAPPVPPVVSGSTHHHSESDGGSSVWTASWSDDSRSAQFTLHGEAKWNDDATDVVSISKKGWLEVSIHEGDRLTHAEILPGPDGLKRTLLVDGAPRAWDAAWFAAFLRDLDRHTGFAAEALFPKLYREQGAQGVLGKFAELGSDYARRRYLTLLVEADPLKEAVAIEVTRQAEKIGSDYERAQLLVAVAGKAGLDTDAERQAFLHACEGIKGDYEHARVLHVLVDQPKLSPALARAALASASTLRGDYEKASLLAALAARHEPDAGEFLKSASTLSGSYEHGRALKALIAARKLDGAAQSEVIRQAARLDDYEAAEVLLSLAAKDALTPEALRDYESAAKRLGEYSRNRVLAALRK